MYVGRQDRANGRLGVSGYLYSISFKSVDDTVEKLNLGTFSSIFSFWKTKPQHRSAFNELLAVPAIPEFPCWHSVRRRPSLMFFEVLLPKGLLRLARLHIGVGHFTFRKASITTNRVLLVLRGLLVLRVLLRDDTSTFAVLCILFDFHEFSLVGRYTAFGKPAFHVAVVPLAIPPIMHLDDTSSISGQTC